MRIQNLINPQVLENAVANKMVVVRDKPDLGISISCYTQSCAWNNEWDEASLLLRGMVWDTETGTIISRCMPKFFNHNQQDITHLVGLEYEIFTKYDGTLIHFGHLEDQLFMTTKLSSDHRILDLAHHVLDEYPHSRYEIHKFVKEHNVTLVCEFLHPANRIVVDYKGLKEFVVLDIIDNETGNSKFHELNFELPSFIKAFSHGIFNDDPYDKISELYEKYNNLKGNQFEGFIFRFSNGERIKVKLLDYILMHKIVTNTTAKDVIQAACDQTSLDLFIDNVPDELATFVKKIYFEISHLIDSRISNSIEAHERIKTALEHISQNKHYVKSEYAGMLNNLKNDFADLDYSPALCYAMADADLRSLSSGTKENETDLWNICCKSLKLKFKELNSQYEKEMIYD